MKKQLLVLCLAFMAMGMNAQDVYNAIVDGYLAPEFSSVVDESGIANNVVDGQSVINVSQGAVTMTAVSGATPIYDQIVPGAPVEGAENLYEIAGGTAWNDIKWTTRNQADINFEYILGSGVPYTSMYAQETMTDGEPTGTYRTVYSYYTPDGLSGMPVTGLYYIFKASTSGALMVKAWINKGRRQTYVVNGNTMMPVEVRAFGYINGQNDENGKKRLLSAAEIDSIHYEWLNSMGYSQDEYQYVIGNGNQAFWGWLVFNVEAGEEYSLFLGNAQIGFGGFEFYEGKTASELVNGESIEPVSYNINVANIENGTVAVDKTSAVAGETVYVTATPAEGYELTSISVTDAYGNNVSMSGNSFVMPESDVVISATFKHFVDLVIDVPANTNISEEIETSLAGNIAKNIVVNLVEGANYIISSPIEATGSISINGNGATIDASILEGSALITNSNDAQTDNWDSSIFNVDGVNIINLSKPLFVNTQNYVCIDFSINNSAIQFVGSYYVIDFKSRGTFRNLSVTNSTIYAPVEIKTRSFVSRCGRKLTEYDAEAIQTITFVNNTLYNISYSRNFFEHRSASQSWQSYNVVNNLFVDCGKKGQVIRGFNGGQISGNPSWYVSGNAFNYDGEDTGETEISYDTYGKIENTVFGVMNFNDPYNGDFNGVFTLPYEAIAPQVLGDQRWTIVYQNAPAPEYSNVLCFGETPEFMKGQNNELSVNLQNEQQIMAFQFDLVLPSGINLNSIYNTWRSERHSVSFNALTNDTVRVVVVSTEGVPFYDNNGQILNMVFNVDNGLSEGDYTLVMKNIEMTTTDYETLRPENQYITVYVKDLLMGDVDSNGQVNVTDVVMIIDNILGKPSWNFNAEVADVNYDSYINVTDVVMVIDHILGKVNLNRAAAADAEMGAISLSTDMTTVSLTNPSAYTAFQMDVTLPMGVSLEDVLLTERAAGSHSVVIRKMEDGSYRIIGVSMQNKAFKDNAGDLLKLQLAGNAQGAVAIDNVLFVTPQGVQHELAGVNAFGDVTGISATLTNNGQMNNDNQYTLDGRKLNGKPMTKGIYVNGGRKVVIK